MPEKEINKEEIEQIVKAHFQHTIGKDVYVSTTSVQQGELGGDDEITMSIVWED